MTPFEYLLLWFGMLTTGFMMGMGNSIAQHYFKEHIKKRMKLKWNLKKPLLSKKD